MYWEKKKQNNGFNSYNNSLFYFADKFKLDPWKVSPTDTPKGQSYYEVGSSMITHLFVRQPVCANILKLNAYQENLGRNGIHFNIQA